ncbi:response regulator [Methylopila sp. Yamaguchi]|uniref:response regulator n=1 Tax=Methylopila sp. Yamaguchi TaxID=1437817 RepID=UPI000CA7EA52|nr:response regulator [Methylopila sp. Yamaguchi]GBD48641.1 signal transduction histidine kinase [Methylopila sp. Yamaguchi]
MAPSDPSDNICVLVCAPFGHDAVSTVALLQEAGYGARALADLSDADALRDERIGALLLTEEALRHGDAGLTRALDAQEPWADLPILFLTAPRSRATPWHIEHVRFRLPPSATNVIVLERPIGAVSLVSAVASALRARRKQYEIRDSIAAQKRVADKLDELVQERTRDLEQALQQLRTEVADRERAEEQLRQAQKMEAVGQLTGGIAHDFNNMLTGVIGSLDIIRRRIDSGRLDDLERFMTAASTSAQRAANLTQRLLAFSRRQSLDPRAIDVNALVRSLEELLLRTIGESIVLQLSLAEPLDAAIADANQLESAILNLAINARDAMPDGGALTVETREVEIEPGARHDRDLPAGAYIVITIADTGVGISTERMKKVFDPFFTTKPIGQGTGLGLSMVYGFAKQSGGQAKISSRVGQGTSVSLYLPSAGSSSVQAAAVQPVGPRIADGDGERVLIVEDEDAVRQVLREALNELGYETEEAADAQAALRLLASERRFDMMISDVGLPGMNGRQLADEARTARPRLPILFVTGYAENAEFRAGFLGANMSMITKPFTLETVADKIRSMLAVQAPPRSRAIAPDQAPRAD